MNILRSFIFILIFLITSCQKEENNENLPQDNKKITISEITDLNSSLNETSGLINFSSRLITHNDSGGKPELYEIDQNTGNIVRTVKILNIENIDMEDISQDDHFIYLGDFGNNSNKRKDQVIYIIEKNDYLQFDQLEAKQITFQYNEQIDFTPSDNITNFDAEALVSIGDYLYLFTKNWEDEKTSVYQIPKLTGNYNINRIDTYDIQGLITGATYDKNTKTIVLTGYKNFNFFIVIITDFPLNNPLGGKINKSFINLSSSIQVEGITTNHNGTYSLSAESSLGFPAVLYKMSLN